MIFSGIIKSINSSFQTCSVAIPALTAPGDKTYIQKNVHFSSIPGIYGSYSTGDTVFISFEENDAANAIIIGKLFVNVNTENSVDKGNISTKHINAESIDVKNLKINGNAFSFSNTLSTIFDSLLSKKQSAEKENYENLTDKFTEYNIKQQSNLKIYPEAQIGTFGIKAINSKEPKLIRQEFVLESPGDTSVINFTDSMKIAALVKINLNDTFLVTDKLTLSPGYYESGAQQFEVKVDLENKQINIKTSGITDIKKIYVTTEYWN